MADQRQSRKDDYIEIPGEVFVMKNLFSLRQISGDGSVVTVPGSQGFIPPPVVLQRSLPSYNEVPGSQSIATLDGYAPTTEQGVKPKSLKQFILKPFQSHHDSQTNLLSVTTSKVSFL